MKRGIFVGKMKVSCVPINQSMGNKEEKRAVTGKLGEGLKEVLHLVLKRETKRIANHEAPT
jgi:hypothetical protein